MTLQPFSPDLFFLENRDYLQGSTLLDAMIDGLRHADVSLLDLDFIFERRTDRQVTIISGEPDRSATKVATLRYAGGFLTAVETDEVISRRVPYDESDLAKTFVSHGDTITVQNLKAAYSFAAAATSAFKTILQKREPKRKFVFARLRIPSIPEDAFSVTFDRRIGNRFYEGHIEMAGHEAGAIYFGVW